MQYIDIKDGCIILHLTPPQCASLAKACRFAGHHTLSDEIDRDKIEAIVQNGVLRLQLPKAGPAKTRKITVKAN